MKRPPRPCRTKHFYVTRDSAHRAKRKRLREGVEYLRVYRCPKCRWWHLTSKQKGGKAKR